MVGVVFAHARRPVPPPAHGYTVEHRIPIAAGLHVGITAHAKKYGNLPVQTQLRQQRHRILSGGRFWPRQTHLRQQARLEAAELRRAAVDALLYGDRTRKTNQSELSAVGHPRCLLLLATSILAIIS